MMANTTEKDPLNLPIWYDRPRSDLQPDSIQAFSAARADLYPPASRQRHPSAPTSLI